MNKIIKVVCVLVMMCTISAKCFVAQETTEIQKQNNEVLALKQYEQLMENLSDEKNSNRTHNVYLDYYGGAYINDDGNLVVCVTSNYADVRSCIQAYTNNDAVLTQLVDYTYNSLLEEQKRISELYKQLIKNKGFNANKESVADSFLVELSGSYIDEINNKLVIVLKNLNEENIKLFKDIFSEKEFIEFEEGENSFELSFSEEVDINNMMRTTYIVPGGSIYTEEGKRLSVGYPVYFLGSGGVLKRGFITAGHAFESGDYVYNSGSASRSRIGVCVASQFSGNVDAALIQMVGEYAITDYTFYRGIQLSSTSYRSNPPVGTDIYKEGSTTGSRYGEVLATSYIAYTQKPELPTIEDTITVSAMNLKGDSGGVVYDTLGRVIGSVSGSKHIAELTEVTFEFCIVSKASNTFEALECSIFEHPYAG